MSDAPRQRTRRAASYGLLLLALLLVCTWLLLYVQPPQHDGLHEPEVGDPEQTIEALVAELSGLDGSRLGARLSPLHVDPERQAFERDSLRRRFDLPEGEPWRLSLEWRAGAGTTPVGSGSARFTGSGPARGEPTAAQLAALGLGPVRIEDEEGTALGPLPIVAGGDDPAPLATLLAPPAGSLGPGQAVDWVLWGRRPLRGAVLIGLLPPPASEAADEFAAATGLAGALVFEPGPVRRHTLVLPLARLERPGSASAGKIGAGGASEQP